MFKHTEQATVKKDDKIKSFELQTPKHLQLKEVVASSTRRILFCKKMRHIWVVHKTAYSTAQKLHENILGAFDCQTQRFKLKGIIPNALFCSTVSLFLCMMPTGEDKCKILWMQFRHC